MERSAQVTAPAPGRGHVRVVRGVPDEAILPAAELLTDAFSAKVRHELRPVSRDQAVGLIAGSIDPSLGWSAFDEGGALVGLAGIGVRGRTFSHIRFSALVREFGVLGAVPRWLRSLLEDLFARPRAREWRIEVLAVDERSRGTGVGTALLTAVIDAAEREGARAVVLEVVDTNERARRLYERLGFRHAFTLPTGPLTAGAGYRAVHFLRRDLGGREGAASGEGPG